MLKNDKLLSDLDNETFEIQARSDLKLYRDVSKKEFTDDINTFCFKTRKHVY